MSLTFILFAAVVFASIIGGIAGVVVWIIDTCGSEK